MGNSLITQSTDIMISAASSLVGFALGGPVGAVVGGITTPIIRMSRQIVQSWIERRKKRISDALNQAFLQTNLSDETVLKTLSNDPPLSDDIIRLLRQLVDTDPEFDSLFASIIASMIVETDCRERRRLIILSDSLKGLNVVQLQIIKLLASHNGQMSATDISVGLDIPEIELRNAVRDLELRGIITDNGSEPTVWELRELGSAIVRMIIEPGESNE